MASEISSSTSAVPNQAPARPPAPTPAAAAARAETPPPDRPAERATLSREATHPEPPGSMPNFGSRGAAGRRASHEEIRERGRQAEAAGGEYANQQFRRGVGQLAQNVTYAVNGDPGQDAKDAARNDDIPGALRAGSAVAGEKAGNRASRSLQASNCVRGAMSGFRGGTALGAAGGTFFAGIGAAPGAAFGGAVGAIGGCALGAYSTRRVAEITGNVVGQTTFDVARQGFSRP